MRPLLFGYVDPHAPGCVDPGAFTWTLETYAETEGFSLYTVFVERAESGDAAFEALLAALPRYESAAVAVPSMEHLAGVFLAVHRLRYEGGASVLIIPSGGSREAQRPSAGC
jgi:hypothetical protein